MLRCLLDYALKDAEMRHRRLCDGGYRTTEVVDHLCSLMPYCATYLFKPDIETLALFTVILVTLENLLKANLVERYVPVTF